MEEDRRQYMLVHEYTNESWRLGHFNKKAVQRITTFITCFQKGKECYYKIIANLLMSGTFGTILKEK